MAKRAQKKQLSRTEEFEIMKLVLDKFLWMGFVIMGFGLYNMMAPAGSVTFGFWVLAGGAVVLVLFMYLLIREYEFMK